VSPKIAGVELTPEQREAIAAGTSVKIENMTDKRGKTYTSYVRYNHEKGKLDFLKWQPGSKQQQTTPTLEHQTQVAANNDGHKSEALKNIKGPVEQKQPNTPTTQQTRQKRLHRQRKARKTK
jgi:hypothetical protein